MIDAKVVKKSSISNLFLRQCMILNAYLVDSGPKDCNFLRACKLICTTIGTLGLAWARQVLSVYF